MKPTGISHPTTGLTGLTSQPSAGLTGLDLSTYSWFNRFDITSCHWLNWTDFSGYGRSNVSANNRFNCYLYTSKDRPHYWLNWFDKPSNYATNWFGWLNESA